MHKRMYVLTLGLAAALSTITPQAGMAQAPDQDAKPVTLVKDGEPQCTIVVAAKPSKMAVLAAADLQWHIKKITDGTVVPVVREGEAIKGLAIYIGESDKVRELGLKNHAFADRELAVKFFPDCIVLTGSADDWDKAPDGPLNLEIKPFEMAGNRGPLFATYEFIENFLGVRWYAPGDENISWPPKAKTLSVFPKDIRRSMAIRDRNTAFGVNINAWGENVNNDDRSLFQLRNKTAGGNVITHSFEGWPERFEDSNSPLFEAYHPEYFSKDRGTSQLCFTDTGTVGQAIADARRWADGKGITHRANVGEDFYGLEPRDTEVRCSCPTCKALLGKPGGFNSDEASAIVWGFADKVARALQESNPGKSVGVLGYGNHAGCPPPSLELATNIYVGMAIFPRGIPNLEDNDFKLYKQWLTRLPGRLSSIWLYPCFPRETAGIQGYTAFPKLEPRGLDAQMKLFASDKVRCFMFCGLYDTVLDYWCSIKFQDNPDVDIEATIAEFYKRYYGPAAEPMQKLMDGIESASAGVKSLDEQTSWDVCGTDERMAEWQKLMDEAVALAVDDPVKKRVLNVRDNLWTEMLRGKKIWNHRKKYQDDVAAFRKLPPLETNAVKLAAAPNGEDARNVDWKAVTPVKIFRTMSGFPAMERSADLYMAHDGKMLYVRLTDHVDINRLKDSGGAWWGDRWEIFFSKQSDRNAGQDLSQRSLATWGPYRQIGVRPNANKCDMWTYVDADWDVWPKIDLKLHNEKGADGWSYYLTIPLDNLSSAGPVKPGDMVYFNFIGPNEASGDVIALSPTFNPGAYHNVPRLAGFHLDE